ncbi:MAG: type II toxin-antitoxin system PemK/MazF family toxin [Magnetococcus sp. YQC-5]
MYQPGDLVMVPFPFSDQDVAKKRPVLVLTLPDERGDFIGLAVTSVPTAQCALEVDINAIIAGSLPKRSWLRIDKIFSLNTRRGRASSPRCHQLSASSLSKHYATF